MVWSIDPVTNGGRTHCCPLNGRQGGCILPQRGLSRRIQIATENDRCWTLDSIGNNEADRVHMFSEFKFNCFGLGWVGCSGVVDALLVVDLASNLRGVNEEISPRRQKRQSEPAVSGCRVTRYCSESWFRLPIGRYHCHIFAPRLAFSVQYQARDTPVREYANIYLAASRVRPQLQRLTGEPELGFAGTQSRWQDRLNAIFVQWEIMKRIRSLGRGLRFERPLRTYHAYRYATERLRLVSRLAPWVLWCDAYESEYLRRRTSHPSGFQLFYQRGGGAQRLGGSTYASAEAAMCSQSKDQIINSHHEGIATNTASLRCMNIHLWPFLPAQVVRNFKRHKGRSDGIWRSSVRVLNDVDLFLRHPSNEH